MDDATYYEPDFAQYRRGYQGFRSTPPDPERCPEGHPLWNRYWKQIGVETIVCCRKCDAEQG